MKLTHQFRAHESHINDVIFTHDDKHLLTAGMDNFIHVWYVSGWEKTRTLTGHEKSVNSLSLNSSGSKLVTASSDRTVRLWHLRDGNQIGLFEEKGNAAVVSAADRFLAIVDRSVIYIKDFKSDTRLLKFKPFPKRITTISFSPDCEWLAIGGQGNEILVYQLPELDLVHTISDAHKAYTLSLTFSPSGQFMASTGLEGKLRFWAVNGWNPIGEVRLENTGVQSIAYAPLGNVVGVSSDHRVTLVDPLKIKVIEKMDVKPKGVYCLAFSSDGQWLACGAADKRIRIFSL